MKFVAFGDVHGEELFLDLLQNYLSTNTVDAVFLLGDLVNGGGLSFVRELIDLLVERTSVFGIVGNVDPKPVRDMLKDRGISVDKRLAEYRGLRITGLDGTLKTPYTMFNELTESEIYETLKNIGIDERTIILTHGPPYGLFDLTYSGKHVGSKSLLKIIKEYHPLLSLSGHVHEQYGWKTVNGTTVVNVIPGNAFNITEIIVSDNNGRYHVRDVKFVSLK